MKNSKKQQAYPSFWPEKSKMEKYGPVFSVHSVSRKHYQNIKQWEYKINKKVTYQMKQTNKNYNLCFTYIKHFFNYA